MKTVLEAIKGGADYLRKRGIQESRLHMELLLAHQLGCSRMQLYTQFDRPLDEEILAPLREYLKKRAEGIPLQHILGEVGFHGHEFFCDARALIPRPETEELVEMILKRLPREPLRMLDVGCGSGVIGLSLAAARQDCSITLVDISSEALQLTRKNAERLCLSNVTIFESDLFSEVQGAFDFIVANLPYVAESESLVMAPELKHDPALALFSGADGLDLLRSFIPVAISFLKPGGEIGLEIGYDQASQIQNLLEHSGFVEVRVENDLAGISRFPFAKKPII